MVADIQQLNPDIVIITGDFTQRALRKQFLEAQEFIKTFDKSRLLCVPGNHDISLHNLVERFVFPYARYQIYVTSELNPQLTYNNIAIAGINSVTPFKVMRGRVRNSQLNAVHDFFNLHPADIKIVAMHHNLIHSERHKMIENAEKILNVFAEAKVNLILSGHLHYACIEQIKRDSLTHFMYVITAGTPTSTRLGNFRNSYNVIDIDTKQFRLVIREFDTDKFIAKQENIFPLSTY